MKNILLITFVLVQFSVRAQLAGMLDSTFDFDGKVVDSISQYDKVIALAMLPDGKILAGGTTKTGTYADCALWRFHNNGSLDAGFGNNGTVTPVIPFGSNAQINKIALQADGKIVAVASNNAYCNVMRFHSDGSWDTSFASYGVAQINFGNIYESTRDVIVRPDGKIYALGGYMYKLHIARLNANGSLDTTFNHSGKLVVDTVGTGISMTLQPDGKLLFAGGDCLMRIDESGVFDTTFNGNGTVCVDTIGIYSIALQNDGKIVCGGAGGTGTYLDFAVIRINPNGSPDTTFTSVIHSIQSGTDWIQNVRILPDAKILAAGSSETFNDPLSVKFTLTCYNPDGSKDLTFGNNGVVMTNFSGWSVPYHMVIQSDNKIILGGYTGYNNSWKLAMARYFSSAVGIEENRPTIGVFIFPNPAHNTFTISLNELKAENAELKMYDMTGRIVCEQKISSQLSTFNFQLAAGIYLVRVEAGEKVWQEKVVVVE